MNLAWDGAHLWTGHTTAEGHVRWYEIDPAGPSLVQRGAYQRSNWSTFLPTIEANSDGMIMVYNASSESKNDERDVFPRIEVAGRTATHTEGELQDHAVVQAGEAGYNDDDTKGDFGPGPEETVLRWGDYNGAAVDPDDSTFWVISQYAKDATPDEDGPAVTVLYGTRIANVEFDS